MPFMLALPQWLNFFRKFAYGQAFAVLIAAISGCDAPTQSNPHSFKGIDVTGAPYGKSLSLTDMNGQRRTLADFKGKVVILYFGFVQCPHVCPTALTRAQGVMEKLGPAHANQVQLLFVTVDPDRDTPALLQEYMKAFDSRFLALMGTAAETEAAAKEFRVYYKKVPTGSTYTMDHTALTYLIDQEGRLRIALRHEQTIDEYVADIQTLLSGA